jgi:hypothetical protein
MDRVAKFLLLLIVFGMWVSCCNVPIPQKNKEREEEVRKYSEIFINSLSPRIQGSNVSRIRIYFQRLGGSTVGECRYTDALGYRQVIFDPTHWDNYSKTRRLVAVYHELGHCVCNLGHTWDGGVYPEASESGIPHTGLEKDGFFEDLCPMSIVFPYILDDECARKHWDSYIKDLYKRCEP